VFVLFLEIARVQVQSCSSAHMCKGDTNSLRTSRLNLLPCSRSASRFLKA
jgi:hypothetical protein